MIGQARTAMMSHVARGLAAAGIRYTLPPSGRLWSDTTTAGPPASDEEAHRPPADDVQEDLQMAQAGAAAIVLDDTMRQ